LIKLLSVIRWIIYDSNKRTSWSWASLEKPLVVQLLKNSRACYGTQNFIIVFTRTLHWSLSWARSIQSILPHPVSVTSTLIFYTHLHLGLPNGLFPSDFPQMSYIHCSSPQFLLYSLRLSSYVSVQCFMSCRFRIQPQPFPYQFAIYSKLTDHPALPSIYPWFRNRCLAVKKCIRYSF
jgi:hypothetical protein